MITKNNSITKFIAAGILVFSLSFTSFAQTTDNDQIIARAEVLTGMDVTGVEDLNFGFVNPGVPKTVGLDGIATPSTSNQTGVTVGQFTIEAGVGADVTMTYTLPATIHHLVSNAPMSIGSYTSSWNTSANAVTGATTFTPASGYNWTSFPVGGLVYVFLGGTVSPTPTQEAGVYEFPVVLTATYN